MSVDLMLVIGVLALAFVALAAELWSPEAVLLAALAVVTAAGVIDVQTAFLGFGNPTLVALGSLYVLAAALRESGALDRAARLILGSSPAGIRRVLLRLCPSVTLYSAFLNNTPVVAMGIPAIRRWGRRHGIPASRLLMPLSFAAILGGMCTLIGTSTNLVTHGLLLSHDMEGLAFFELAWVGVPCAVAGLLYLILVSPSLTPVRRDIREEEERERALLVELELTEASTLVGRPLAETGLERLPGLRLARVNRERGEIAPVPPDEVLRAGDRLLYEAAPAPGGASAGGPWRAPGAPPGPVPEAGPSRGTGAGAAAESELGAAAESELGAAAESELGAGGESWRGEPPVPDLSDFPGLRLAARAPRRIRREGRDRELHEVVVKEGSRLVGSTVEEVHFLERFGSAVTGIRRGGRRLEQPLGEVALRPGDVLMLDTGPAFREAFEDAEEFFVTTEVGGDEAEEAPPEAEALEEELPAPRPGGRKLWISVAVLLGLVAVVTAGLLHIALAGLLGMIVLFTFGVIEPGEARAAVDWSVLVVIGAALGLGQAMEASGAAELFAGWVVEATGAYGSRAVLAGVVVATGILTEIITNNGAAALMFPIALSVAESEGYSPRALLVGMTLAASMSLLTPIGYQTNLMVYGPGNYRFGDFFRVGGPLQLLLWLVVVLVAPEVWPL